MHSTVWQNILRANPKPEPAVHDRARYGTCLIEQEVDSHYHARSVQARSVFLHADGLLVHTIMQNQAFSGTVRTFEC